MGTRSIVGNRLGLTDEGGLQAFNPDTNRGALLGQSKVIFVTAAESIALFTTPKTLLPAPGAGKAIVVERVTIHKPAGTAYAGVAVGEDLVLKYTNAAGQQISSVIETTGFVDQATAQTRLAFPPASTGATAGDITPAANAAVVLHQLVGDMTTGTTGLYVQVRYDVINTVFVK